jgi:hypothetical protein
MDRMYKMEGALLGLPIEPSWKKGLIDRIDKIYMMGFDVVT